jgi:hypothetical protein
VEPRHRRIAQIALSAGGPFGLALAGGYAVREHGMGRRPSGDVDLFTDWQLRADFPAAVDAVIDALSAHGYMVAVASRTETFARLLLRQAAAVAEDTTDKLELAADWRQHPPVMLEVGPVLHPDDAVTNKMSALYGRAQARDFLDVDAAIISGRYSRERLLELAVGADPGFEPLIFADAIASLTQLTDTDFDEYGITPHQLHALRQRFADWRDKIRATSR